MRVSDFITGESSDAPPEIDERLQRIVRKSGYKTNNQLRGLLVVAILYRLLKERQFDRTLAVVLLFTLVVDIGYQLYYQYQQGLFPTGE